MNNQFIFIGRICRNLVLKEVGSSKVLDVALAITRSFKNSEGAYETDFIKCKAFGQVAENINEFCKVGDLISVCGRVQTGSYTNQEDKKVYTTDFVINKVQYLATGKKDQEEPKKQTEDPYEEFSLEHTEELEEMPFD